MCLSLYPPRVPNVQHCCTCLCCRVARNVGKTPRQHTSVITSISRTNNAIQSLPGPHAPQLKCTGGIPAKSGAITHCLLPAERHSYQHVMFANQPATPGSFDSDMSQQTCLLPPALGAMSSHYVRAPQESPGARDALYPCGRHHSGIRPLPVRNNAVGLDFITTNGAITPADRMSRAKK